MTFLAYVTKGVLRQAMAVSIAPKTAKFIFFLFFFLLYWRGKKRNQKNFSKLVGIRREKADHDRRGKK